MLGTRLPEREPSALYASLSGVRVPRRRLSPGRRLLVALCVALWVALGWTQYEASRPPLLGGDGVEMSALSPGDVMAYGVRLRTRGSGTVRVTSVRVSGVPDGVEVVAVNGVSGEDGFVGAMGDPARRPSLRLYPVTAVRAGDGQRWYVLVTVRVTRPGTWHVSGIDVTWRRGWRRGTTHVSHDVTLSTEPEPAP